MPNTRFAARLTSFASGAGHFWPGQPGQPLVVQTAERAALVPGPTELDHGKDFPARLATRIAVPGLEVSRHALRHYRQDFRRGALTNPDPEVRQSGIDQNKRGIDATRTAGAGMLTPWLGQDGRDYAFQCDYARLWADETAGIGAVAARDRDFRMSIAYKPNAPRSFSLSGDMATNLLAVQEVDLNVDNGRRDDGLMVASGNPVDTPELPHGMAGIGNEGPIYFDTSPDPSGLDPVRESGGNIRVVARLMALSEQFCAEPGLAVAQANQNAVASQRIVQGALFGI